MMMMILMTMMMIMVMMIDEYDDHDDPDDDDDLSPNDNGAHSLIDSVINQHPPHLFQSQSQQTNK